MDDVLLPDPDVELELLALLRDHGGKEGGLGVGELELLVRAQLELTLVGEPFFKKKTKRD